MSVAFPTAIFTITELLTQFNVIELIIFREHTLSNKRTRHKLMILRETNYMCEYIWRNNKKKIIDATSWVQERRNFHEKIIQKRSKNLKEEEETLRDLFCFKNATMARSEQCSALLATRQLRGWEEKTLQFILVKLNKFLK